MAYWEWQESMDIGIATIDQQHRKIADYINALDVAARNKDSEAVAKVLDELVGYTVNHFSFEEFLMQHGEYPAFENHRNVHNSFRERIRIYQERVARGEDVSRELLKDLKVWLTNHIERDDKDYAPYVLRKNDKGWVNRMLKRVFG